MYVHVGDKDRETAVVSRPTDWPTDRQRDRPAVCVCLFVCFILQWMGENKAWTFCGLGVPVMVDTFVESGRGSS